MNEQADLLQPQPSEPPSATPFVFLTGGKGGVGKSLIAANLGCALAARGRRILLVDFDLSLANLDVLLDVTPERTSADLLSGAATLEECLVRFDLPENAHAHSRSGGLWILPGACGESDLARADAARRRHLLREVFRASAGFDLILGDGAAGVAPDQLAFAAAAHQVLAVTTSDPAALTDAYGLVKALGQRERDLRRALPTPRVLFNRVAGSDHAAQLDGHFTRVCMRFLGRKPRTAGWLPESREVRRCIANRRPVVTEHPGALFTSRLTRVAVELERELLSAARPRPVRGATESLPGRVA